jgi:pyruvate ferredoxin oxidoreductase alpha subunit
MAPRIAEHPDVLLPVLVCLDGFTITHSAEPVELLPDEAVKQFVGEYRIAHPVLDAGHPSTQGPFAMPDYYYEFRRSQAAAIEAALPLVDEIAAELARISGRILGALEAYRVEDAEQVVISLGSTAGTVKDVVDELRERGERVGAVKICSYRPFPAAALRDALAGVQTAIVLDRADSPGGAPPLYAETAAALFGSGIELRGHVYGLGGRDLHPPDVSVLLADAQPGYVGVRGEPCPA